MLSAKSKKYISIGLIFHLIAVIYSIGFYRHDEQREVLQVVGYKLGMYDDSYLSFQFHSMLRPWLHPLLYIWPTQLAGLYFKLNPFTLAFFYRLLSSVIGIGSLWALYKSFEEEFFKNEKNQNLYFFFAGFLWFLPFLHARTANENLCTSFFLFGLYFLKKNSNTKNALLAGVLLGISFILRFQMIVMIVPTLMWFLIFNKYPIKKYLLLSLSFLVFVAINTIIDSYYYGQFTFTPYNYFFVNIVQKYAATFGVNPWYDYFIQGFKDGGPPLSLFFIAAYLLLWIRFPKSLLTWVTLPFLVVHSLIGHKEFRFIFPMIFFLPMILTFLIIEMKIEPKKWQIILFQVINIPLLIYFSSVPASTLMKYYEFLYYKPEKIEQVYISNPFEDYTKFYMKNDIHYVLYKPEEMKYLVSSASAEKKAYFFAMSLKERNLLLDTNRCKIDFSLFPEWVYEMEFIKKRRTFRSWTLVECSNQ